MDKSEVKNYLENSEEGQTLFAELTDGLRKNRDTILSEKKAIQEDYNRANLELEQLRRENFATRSKNAIREELQQYNIDPEILPLVELHFESLDGLQIDDDGSVVVGETPLAESIEEYFAQGPGRKLRRVNSTGSGATGSNGGSNIGAEAAFAAQLRNSMKN